MRMNLALLHKLLIALILLSVSTVTIATMNGPVHIEKPMPEPKIMMPLMPIPSPGPMPLPMPEPSSPSLVSQTNAEAPDSIVLAELTEIKAQAEHYYSQAKNYETFVFALRIVVFICSVLAAAVLALSSADWSRRAALVLSIGAAAVPAADQIFQASEMHRVSWRTAVDVSRLFENCKDSWAFGETSPALEERKSAARAAVSKCREKLSRLVDAEMETSLKPLQLPITIKPK